MKFLKIFLAVLMVMIPLEVMAETDKFVAAEFQCNFHRHPKMSTKAIPHINLVAGYKFHQYMMIELGGYHSVKMSHENVRLTKRAVHGTFLGYYPLSEDVTFKFGAGGSQYLPTVKDKGKDKKSYSRLIPRVLAGIDVKVNDDISVRVTTIWERASMLEKSHKCFKNDNIHLNLGLAYTF